MPLQGRDVDSFTSAILKPVFYPKNAINGTDTTPAKCNNKTIHWSPSWVQKVMQLTTACYVHNNQTETNCTIVFIGKVQIWWYITVVAVTLISLLVFQPDGMEGRLLCELSVTIYTSGSIYPTPLTCQVPINSQTILHLSLPCHGMPPLSIRNTILWFIRELCNIP